MMRSNLLLTTTRWLLYLQLVAAIAIGASADKSSTSRERYYEDIIDGFKATNRERYHEEIDSIKGDGDRSLIVGGVTVDSESKYPFFGVLIGTRQYPNEFGNATIRSTTLCGSSLIATDVLLTIGRCLNYPDMIEVHVVLEAIDFNDADRQVIQAENWTINDSEFDEDRKLALVYLMNPAVNVGITNPNVHGDDDMELNDKLTTMGYGVTDEFNDPNLDNAVNSELLMEVDILVNDTSLCEVDYDKTLIEAAQFCAGGGGTGACLGDAGGPAIDKNGDLVGIVSIGIIECGIFPTVFTRVNGYKNFIKDAVCNRTGIVDPIWCDPNPPAPPMFGICFAESNQIQVKNEEVIQNKDMKDLSIGDMVHVGDGIYEPVYSFGHYAPSMKSEMLQIETATTAPLRISPNHMVVTASKGTIPASQLQVGDELLTSYSSDVAQRVQKIDSVVARGMYAPFTPSGKIVVDGILASSYIAFEDNEGLEFGMMKISHQWMAHAGSFPHRFMCYYSNSCANEKYSAEGIADGVFGSFMFYKNIFETTNTYGWLVRSVVFGLVLIVLMAFTAMEAIVSSMTNPSVQTTVISFVVMVGSAKFFHANNKKGKTQQ